MNKSYAFIYQMCNLVIHIYNLCIDTDIYILHFCYNIEKFNAELPQNIKDLNIICSKFGPSKNIILKILITYFISFHIFVGWLKGMQSRL